MNFVIDGFYRHLTNPFIFAHQEELPSGVAVLTKRNGDGASVSGVNIESNVAFGNKLVLHSGATIIKAFCDSEEVLWTLEIPLQDLQFTTTNRLLRTPNTYSYFSIGVYPI